LPSNGEKLRRTLKPIEGVLKHDLNETPNGAHDGAQKLDPSQEILPSELQHFDHYGRCAYAEKAVYETPDNGVASAEERHEIIKNQEEHDGRKHRAHERRACGANAFRQP
jgi:hypothetical protein